MRLDGIIAKLYQEFQQKNGRLYKENKMIYWQMARKYVEQRLLKYKYKIKRGMTN